MTSDSCGRPNAWSLTWRRSRGGRRSDVVREGLAAEADDTRSDSVDLVCFSHLRWDFVWQRPQHLLEKALQHGRHVAEPERVEDDEVLRPLHCLLRLRNRCGRRRRLPFLRAAQQRQLEASNIDDARFVPGLARRALVGAGERVHEMPARRIGMALQNGDALAHQALLR